MLGSMQLTKRLDLQNTRTQKRVLLGFLTAQAIVLAIHHLIRRRILRRKDMTLIKYLDQPPPSILPPPSSDSQTTTRLVKTTHMDYDLEQVGQAQRQTLTNLALMTFLYYQFGVVRPLIVQSLLPVRNALAAKLAQHTITMKIQIISLLAVATSALAQMRLMEQAPSVHSSTFIPGTAPLYRRTLVGDEYTVTNQVDNSRGKQTFSIDHNGDSSTHKGLLYDLVDPSSSSSETGSRFFRRSLLSDLFGGDSTSISNVNDNSKHTQTMNSHGNKNVKITKIHKQQETGYRGEMSPEAFFDKRDLTTQSDDDDISKRSLLGDLFGGDSTSISNVNDNSKHSQTMNSHGNKNVQITKKIHKEQHTGGHGDISPEAFFNKRSLLGDIVGSDSTMVSNVNDNSKHSQTMNSHGNRHSSETLIHKEVRDPEGNIAATKDTQILARRGLLFGGKRTSISNVNDNSQSTKTLNSHGNTDVSKSYTDYRSRSGRGRDYGDMYRRGLLFGGDELKVSNENYNGQETKTLNVHDNVDKTVVYQKVAREEEEGEEDELM
ncbi:hypothetical protein BGZ81_010204 [Podila clonocystis]|nr:hypothetical protein BGZ81_010204 [Podila clonocystis]